MNNKLQQREAAHGVLLYAKKKIIDVKDGKDILMTKLNGISSYVDKRSLKYNIVSEIDDEIN